MFANFKKQSMASSKLQDNGISSCTLFFLKWDINDWNLTEACIPQCIRKVPLILLFPSPLMISLLLARISLTLMTWLHKHFELCDIGPTS
jgi:hypothetical protein